MAFKLAAGETVEDKAVGETEEPEEPPTAPSIMSMSWMKPSDGGKKKKSKKRKNDTDPNGESGGAASSAATKTAAQEKPGAIDSPSKRTRSHDPAPTTTDAATHDGDEDAKASTAESG